jgi:hypothetical protein
MGFAISDLNVDAAYVLVATLIVLILGATIFGAC